MTALRHGPNGRLGISPERRLPESPDGTGGASATSVACAVDQRNVINCADARRGA
jgi:hypothetical protein